MCGPSNVTAFAPARYATPSLEALVHRLRGNRLGTVNAVSEEQSDKSDASAVIRNIEQWADGLHKTAKGLLLAAAGAKSSFTIAMIQWTTA